MILGPFTHNVEKPVQPNLHLPKFSPTDGTDDANQKSLLELQELWKRVEKGNLLCEVEGECQESIMQNLSLFFLTWFMFETSQIIILVALMIYYFLLFIVVPLAINLSPIKFSLSMKL